MRAAIDINKAKEAEIRRKKRALFESKQKVSGNMSKLAQEANAASGTCFEVGGYVKARQVQADRLPIMSKQAIEVTGQKVTEVLRGEENPDHDPIMLMAKLK